MKILALDIGTRRTGVAYSDPAVGFPLALPTLEHTSKKEFAELVMAIIAEKKIERVVVGLPYLPSGEEGSQAEIVREYAGLLEQKGMAVTFVDERYTTPKKGPSRPNAPTTEDLDKSAAIGILNTFLGC